MAVAEDALEAIPIVVADGDVGGVGDAVGGLVGEVGDEQDLGGGEPFGLVDTGIIITVAASVGIDAVVEVLELVGGIAGGTVSFGQMKSLLL